MSSWVPVNEAINSHEDACPTDDIFQVVNPVPVLISLLDPHAAIVAHELQLGTQGFVTLNAELTGRRRVDALPARCSIDSGRLAGKAASRWRSG
jgi:hypothetical protein